MYFWACGRVGRNSLPAPSMAATMSTAAPPNTATVRYWRWKADTAGEVTEPFAPRTKPSGDRSEPEHRGVAGEVEHHPGGEPDHHGGGQGQGHPRPPPPRGVDG